MIASKADDLDSLTIGETFFSANVVFLGHAVVRLPRLEFTVGRNAGQIQSDH